MRAVARLLVVVLLAGIAVVPGGDQRRADAGTKKMFVVWSPRGLPAKTKRHLEAAPGVKAATPVLLTTDWLMRSWLRDGTKIDRPPKGYGYPSEVIVIKPGAFSHFVPTEYRDEVASLGRDEAIVSRTEARLRGAGEGLRLGYRSGRKDVTAVVPDAATMAYEALFASPAPSKWKHSVRYFLVRGTDRIERSDLREAVRDAAGDVPMGIAGAGEGHLRYAASVRPLARFKAAFGEFPAQPADGGSFRILGKWVGRHIRTDAVPILGNVTCHRKLFPQLRGALEELRRKGLSHLIRPSEYAGCYNARFTAVPPGTRLSRHSWGIALDINTSGNGFGQEPHQDGRLVRIMRRWGFTWGGPWPIPDGMHFEWERFPD